MELLNDVSMALDRVDPVTIVAILVGLVLVVAFTIVVAGRRRMRVAALEGTFGAEYWRTVTSERTRRRAEEALARRVAHRQNYETRALSDQEREAFSSRWNDLQASFVDGPAYAERAALELLGEVAATRGYPDDDPERCLDDISVDHPELVADLRGSAHPDQRDWATTEHHRATFVHARALFQRLLKEGDGDQPEEPREPEGAATKVG